MPIKNPKTIILGIIILASILRLFRLGTIPSLNPDEAALGYNAYSLLQTGRDEHGISWPLHLKSFGDFKPAGYTYLALPFIKFLGLTPLAIRLPNAILSIFSVYLLYKIVLLLTSNFPLSSLTALILAVNPWHLHFSRGAWESSTALTLILLGIYFFFKQKLYFSLFFFILSTYFYHSARIIAPLLFLSLLTVHRSQFTNLKKLFLPFTFGLILVIPVLHSFLQNGGTTRFGGVGLTADYGPISRAEELLNHHMNVKFINRAIHNKRVLYILSWGQKYTSHFDLNFLFLNGDEVPRSKSPEMGQFYLLELPFLLLGLYYLIHSTIYHRRSKIFIVIFLLISPLASSLTFQAPAALRSLPLVIPLTIITSLGLYIFLKKFSFFTVYCLLITIYALSLIYYLDSYYLHSPKRYPFAWNQGFSQLVPTIESQKHNFTNIYITDKYDQPYILYLFFAHYPPQKLHPQIQLTPADQFGFSTVSQIDNIHFSIPPQIPPNSLVVEASDFSKTGQSFTIYTK